MRRRIARSLPAAVLVVLLVTATAVAVRKDGSPGVDSLTGAGGGHPRFLSDSIQNDRR